MSLHGNLEQFPLVDVIQLLHITNKSGVLHLKSSKGESQLVFHDGFLVGANHRDNSVRIGKVLVDMNAITLETLNQALAEQKAAGKDRKPLIAVLIERGGIDKETAYKGLETLIEMTIVEVLTWGTGTFSFDVSHTGVSDEYRYFPETIQQEVLLNAQGVLLESLRMYDEKMREGTLHKLFFTQETVPFAFDFGTQKKAVPSLDALDTISRKIQDLFTGLNDYAHSGEQCRTVTGECPESMVNQQEEMVKYLGQISAHTEES